MSKLRVFKVNGECVKPENIKKRNEKAELSEMEKRVVRMVNNRSGNALLCMFEIVLRIVSTSNIMLLIGIVKS
jgi:hypothetical protein